MTSKQLTRTMSVGRDYATSSRYEYVLFEGERVVARQGNFKTPVAARRAGIKAAS